ncbi:MAG: hypothetical protein VB089_11915 [Anaerolineaceae bacterium]|nr:hypothetical protein [Anaerolineaceae bacterium]
MISLHEKLSSDSLRERISWSVILFLILFFGVTIISYVALPEELLKNKHPLQNWENSDNAVILTLQIFFYNLMSVGVIILAGLFGTKKEEQTHYLSLGYQAFFTLICLNAVILGTWSFSSASDPIPLPGRILRTFDLVHRGGPWEMMGQLLVACSTAHIATVLSSGKHTVTRKIREIRLSRPDKIAFGAGITCMFLGAVVESISIHALG